MIDYLNVSFTPTHKAEFEVARKAVLDAASDPGLAVMAFGEGPHYVFVHASGDRAKVSIDRGVRLLEAETFSEAFSKAYSELQAWPRGVYLSGDHGLLVALLVEGNPKDAFLDIARGFRTRDGHDA